MTRFRLVDLIEVRAEALEIGREGAGDRRAEVAVREAHQTFTKRIDCKLQSSRVGFHGGRAAFALGLILLTLGSARLFKLPLLDRCLAEQVG